MWGRSGESHIKPTQNLFSPYETHVQTTFYPDGTNMGPIWCTWGPYGPHMVNMGICGADMVKPTLNPHKTHLAHMGPRWGVRCKIYMGPIWAAHVGPIFIAQMKPHPAHMGPRYFADWDGINYWELLVIPKVRFSEGSLFRNTQVSYTKRFISPK